MFPELVGKWKSKTTNGSSAGVFGETEEGLHFVAQPKSRRNLREEKEKEAKTDEEREKLNESALEDAFIKCSCMCDTCSPWHSRGFETDRRKSSGRASDEKLHKAPAKVKSSYRRKPPQEKIQT